MRSFLVLLMSLAVCLVFAVHAGAIEFDNMKGVSIHGFVSQGALYSDTNNFYADTEEGTVKFNEIGINFGTDMSDMLHLGLQLFARNLGEFGGGEIEIDWAYADYHWRDWAGLRVGKMKVPHGYSNSTRDMDFLRTTILIPQSIYNEAWRSTLARIQGAELYGYLGALEYQFQGGLVEIEEESGVASTTKEQLLLLGVDYNIDDTEVKETFTGHLGWDTFIDGLKIGSTIWKVKFDMTGTSTIKTWSPYNNGHPSDLFTTSAYSVTPYIYFTLGDLSFITEYSFSSYDFSFKTIDRNLETEGYYTGLFYRLTNWLELGVYYSVYYADKSDKDGTKGQWLLESDAWLKDTSLSMRFDMNENWIFKLEGHLMDGTALMMKSDNSGSDIYNPDREKEWYLIAGKMTFSF